MNPFLFNSQDRRLFGIYHPAGGQRRRRAAVICPPFGREYLLAHRACRLLAERLCSSGLDVLRFDYFGTGDSAGEGDEVSLAGCVEDTVVAVEEIKALAGVSGVGLVGIRLGGAIGLIASGRARGLDRLVLWDPVSDGRAYLEELRGNSGEVRSQNEFVKGFPLPPELEDELRNINLKSLTAKARHNLRHNLLVVSQEQARYHGLLEQMRATTRVEYELRPSVPIWQDESGAVPMDVIERIAAWMQ